MKEGLQLRQVQEYQAQEECVLVVMYSYNSKRLITRGRCIGFERPNEVDQVGFYVGFLHGSLARII